MKCELRVTGEFDAAHQLPLLGKDHKCAGLHGHHYDVEIAVSGEPNPKTGVLLDYYEIKSILDAVCVRVEHIFLNEGIPEAGEPTTENLCRWFWRELHRGGLNLLVEVRISETPGFCCVFRG